MFGINLKVLVAMVTELCTHSISAVDAMPCSAFHAPEICILHASANFEKSKTIFLTQIFFLESLNSVLYLILACKIIVYRFSFRSTSQYLMYIFIVFPLSGDGGGTLGISLPKKSQPSGI